VSETEGTTEEAWKEALDECYDDLWEELKMGKATSKTQKIEQILYDTENLEITTDIILHLIGIHKELERNGVTMTVDVIKAYTLGYFTGMKKTGEHHRKILDGILEIPARYKRKFKNGGM